MTIDISTARSAPRRDERMYIDGDWVESRGGNRFDSIDPFSARVWATAPQADADDVDAAVAAASRALHGPWREMSASERGKLILRLADALEEAQGDLAIAETMDNGKLLREMSGQMALLPAWYRYFGGAADKVEGSTIPPAKTNYLIYTRREPIGVVGAILPWNSPLLVLAYKLAPALAAGCTFVAKPAEQTPVSILDFARVFESIGFPPGVFNVVTGGGDTGRLLTAHPKVDKVAFTGSTATGIKVMKSAADHLADVTLELGGKSPNIVFDDADLDAAANGVISGIFAATGQTCVAGSRLFVHRDVHDDLVARVSERARTINLGDPLQADTEMGPIAFADQLEKVLSYVDIATGEGAKVVAGGGRSDADHLKDGLFFEPTVIAGVSNDMRLAQEEVFGPILAVIPFDTEEEVVRLANESDYGLAAGVWTKDGQRAHRVAHKLEAGNVWINSYRNVSYNVPFGGFKSSGIGRENGQEAIDHYLQTKAIWVELSGETRDPFTIG